MKDNLLMEIGGEKYFWCPISNDKLIGEEEVTDAEGAHPTHRAHICHEYHELYSWRKIVMFRNFGEVLGKFGKLRRNFVKF